MQESIAKERRKTGAALWIILAAIPVVMIAAYLILARDRGTADWAVRHFSRPVRDFLGNLNSHVPFSVMEGLYTVLGAGLIVFLVRTVFVSVKAERHLLTLLRRLCALFLAVLYIFGLYLWLWGIDYKAYGFSDKEDFRVNGVSTEELYSAARFFVSRAMELADTVERDENGSFSEDTAAYFGSTATLYDALEERFPSLEAESRTPKKMLLYSKIMSRMGFTGVYFPFTGESSINIDAPAAFIPCTVAHELAHQRGVYSEQECNFLGVAACVTSDLDVYRYSGYLSGSLYLMNALYRASPELWRELRSEFSGHYLQDWQENSEYWQRMETKVTTVSEAVYDTYLKANGQSMGIRSYGACVDLLVAYYKQGGFTQ